MGKEIFKVDELVYVSSHRGDKGYGIIVSMMELDGINVLEKEIITGCGDRNTKINIEIKIISGRMECLWDISSPIKILETPYIIAMSDGHGIIKLMDFKNQYKNKIRIMDRNMDFFKKNSKSRDEKIDILIS